MIENKDTFLTIMDIAYSIQKRIGAYKTERSGINLYDSATIVLEYIKEFYLNFPLKGESSAITCSSVDELGFCSMRSPDAKIKNRRRKYSFNKSNLLSTINRKKAAKEEHKITRKFITDMGKTFIGTPSNLETIFDEFANESEYEEWKHNTIHLACGTKAIISIVKAPYLSTMIIIRDATGRHAWLMNEHREFDWDYLNRLDYSDKKIVKKNALMLREEKIKDSMIKPAPDFIRDTLEQTEEKMNEEIKRVRENNVLDKIVNTLLKHYPDTKRVHYKLIIVQRGGGS